MPKPSVSFAKRQREQAKRERQQMKAARRAERKANAEEEPQEPVQSQAEEPSGN